MDEKKVEFRARLKGRKILRRLFPILSAYCLLLGLLNLLAGLGFLFLGGQYLLDMFGLIDTPNPKWVGWFVDDLFHKGWSSESCQAVIGAMVLGISLVITSIDYLARNSPFSAR